MTGILWRITIFHLKTIFTAPCLVRYMYQSSQPQIVLQLFLNVGRSEPDWKNIKASRGRQSNIIERIYNRTYSNVIEQIRTIMFDYVRHSNEIVLTENFSKVRLPNSWLWKRLQFTASSQVPTPIIRRIYSIYWNLWRQKRDWHDFAVLGSD